MKKEQKKKLKVLLFQSKKINDQTILKENMTFNKREKNEKYSSINQFLLKLLRVKPGLHWV